MTGENLTIADISIATTLTMPTLLDEDGEYTRYPKIASWLAKIHSTEEWKEVDKKFQIGRSKVRKDSKK